MVVPVALVDTAERLFGQGGVDVVSMRAIAREAGVAPAALTYHYPTKEILVDAVVDRRGRPVGRRVRENLIALVASREVPTMRQVVDAILVPLVGVLNADPVGGLYWMKIVARLAASGNSLFYDGVELSPSVTELLAQATARAMPTGHESLRPRMGFAMYGMCAALASSDQAGHRNPLGPGGLDPRFADQLGVFTAAGLGAGTRH